MRITRWRKSSFSGYADCVELARTADDHVGLRQSRRPDDVTLTCSAHSMAAFIGLVKAGGLDDLR